MQIITIELLDDKALALLKQLEQLHILRLISPGKPVSKPKRQWAGSDWLQNVVDQNLPSICR
ncbi:MAG: hypothetical protein IPJ40_18495 [Saprospirales bacterium]|nr:hypothetical protein [Saprospirales bacterium]